MGRKKKYDRDALVAKAMAIFREHGFAGTSAGMLVSELGVNRYSLYAEFGSKQGLFDAALQRYDEEVLGRRFGPLEKPGAGVVEIRALLDFYGCASDGPAAGRGCLLCNTAVEFGADDPTGAGFVGRYFERVSSAFSDALSNARRAGEVRRSVDPGAEAGFFTAAVLGMFVMLRANAPASVVESAARVAVAHLDSLRTGPRR
ncbi:MAG: TetR/AcrR family transcriptional regulator [Sandaracinaceae bacterium]